MQRLEEARSQQTQQASKNGIVTECPPINKDMVWSQAVGGLYKGRIYGMQSFYSDALSPVSVTGNAPARSEQVEEAIRTHVHSFNEELQQQLQPQEERFKMKETKLKKRLKTMERKIGKKMERRIIRQMWKYFQDLRASSLSLPSPEWSRYQTNSLHHLLFLRLPLMMRTTLLTLTGKSTPKLVILFFFKLFLKYLLDCLILLVCII